MGMFKASRRPLSPEDEAALARLAALASRTRVASSVQISAPAPGAQAGEAETPRAAEEDQ